ncbi:hypothetical protein B0H11DRAFT_2317492, partial [Mycena galericulata]
PVLSLPNEITSEIFTQFLPSYPERSLLFGPLSPSFLCRICRQWRYVALATPVLWNALRLDLIFPRHYKQQLHLLELWLQRSGGCPLSLELLHYCRMPNDSTTSFVKAIMHHAHRWEEIRLILPQNEFHHITGPMPLLRNVFIGPTDFHEPEIGVAPVVLFAQAPKLKDVALHLTFNPFSITLPWSQMTTITATLVEKEAIAILRDTPALEECRFSLCYDAAQPAERILPLPPLVSLRSLSLLALNGDEMAVSMGRFLAALNLPALESVTIFEPFLGPDPVAALSALCPS